MPKLSGKIVIAGSIHGNDNLVGHGNRVTLAKQDLAASSKKIDESALTTEPLRRQLRKRLRENLPTDSALEAFCLDFFPAAYSQFTAGMDREQKLTLLLLNADLETLAKRIL